MADTSIAWTDKVWNPVTGCSPVSKGCQNCYAAAFARRQMGQWKGRMFHEVRCHEERLETPLHWRKPARIFVNSMSDLFHESVPDAFIDRVFAVMALCPRHTFQVLTKRPERMRGYLAWSGRRQRVVDAVLDCSWVGKPQRMTAAVMVSTGLALREGEKPKPRWPLPNVWLGVSCEDQATADERIPILLQTPAAVRFVSLEPMLGPVTLYSLPGGPGRWQERHGDVRALDWVIVGGENGPRPCDVGWIRSIVQQCQAAGVPAFTKQLGALPVMHCGQCGRTVGRVMSGWVDACGPAHAELIAESQRVKHTKGADMAEWPADLRVRQFPGQALGMGER